MPAQLASSSRVLLRALLRTGACAIALVGTLALSAAPASAEAETTVIADGLEFATNVAITPDGRIFYTEKDTGRVRVIEDGELVDAPFAELEVSNGPEEGLLGIAAHPDFAQEPWIYLYYSDGKTGRNRIVRVEASGEKAGDTQPVIDLLPTSNGYHNGGDMAFGPDGMLYATTGDGHDEQLAQDPQSAGGKILRLAPDGSIPPDNPLGPESPVYSLGHRNSFGICFDGGTDELWETENGPETNDEVNLIVPGGNYGWPEQQGPPFDERFVAPVLNFEEVVVPTGCAAFNGKVLFGDLSGRLHAFEATDPEGSLQIAEEFDAPIIDVFATEDQRVFIVTTESILEITDIEVGGLEELPSPSPVAEETSPAGGESLRTPAWISGVVALALVLGGGMIFWRWQKRSAGPADRSQDPGAGEDQG